MATRLAQYELLFLSDRFEFIRDYFQYQLQFIRD